MGMSTYVRGVLDDKEYENMLDIYNACKKANVEIPEEVLEYFQDIEPNGGKVVEVQYEEEDSNDYSLSYIVDLSKLDKKIKKIIFTNSW